MNALLGSALFTIQILCFISAVAIFAEFRHSRYPGNLLTSGTLFLAAVSSDYLTAWWPLFVAAGLVWFYGRMGLEPR
jgi:hypothetical protein